MSCKLYLILAAIGVCGTYAVKDRQLSEAVLDLDTDVDSQYLATRAALQKVMKDTVPLQNTVFESADSNSDGKISFGELKKIMGNSDIAKFAIHALDTDFDGMINTHELFHQQVRPPPFVHFAETSTDGKAKTGDSSAMWSPSCLTESKKYWQWVATQTRGVTAAEEAATVQDVQGTLIKEQFKGQLRDQGYTRAFTPTQDLCEQLLKFSNFQEFVINKKKPKNWIKWQICENLEYTKLIRADPVGYKVLGIPTTKKSRENAAKRIDDYFVGMKHDCNIAGGFLEVNMPNVKLGGTKK